jgi:hypothetical protein
MNPRHSNWSARLIYDHGLGVGKKDFGYETICEAREAAEMSMNHSSESEGYSTPC